MGESTKNSKERAITENGEYRKYTENKHRKGEYAAKENTQRR